MSELAQAFIFDAVRTPRGKGRAATEDKPGGALAGVAPHELVAQLVTALGVRNGRDALDGVARLILGCVGQVGAQGGHIALVSRLASQLPQTVSVKSINNYCVSGLSAAGEASLWATNAATGLSLAGGVECLSQVPFLADQAAYYTNPQLREQLRWVPPVMGAELLASVEGYTKSELDAITFTSHQRAVAAWTDGRYARGVVPVVDHAGAVVLERDELPRPDITMEQLQALPPAFAVQGEAGFDAILMEHRSRLAAIDHVHSIANCPGMADGAALVLIGSGPAGVAAGLLPRARIVSYTEAAGDPILQFTAGFTALDQALDEAGMTLADMDLIEFMEAFAAVPLKFLRSREVDPAKVNVNGGHLAMGHPMGATGAILVTTLLDEMERRDVARGLIVAHAGGGIGAAMVIERL